MDIRIYVARGCPNCEAVSKFFAEKNISVEQIEIGFDPIAQAGVRSMSTGQLPLPLIVSYATQEVLYGNDPAQLQRVADAVLAGRAGASHATVQ